MGTCMWIILVLATTAVFFNKAISSRILLLPLSHGSHVIFFCSVGNTLKTAGHDVYVLTGPRYQKLVTDSGISSLSSILTTDPNIIEDNFVKQENSPVTFALNTIPIMKNFTRFTFADDVLMKTLRELNFDLVLIDGMDGNRYMYLIPYKLSVPYVTIAGRPDAWSFRVSALPSVEGTWPLFVLTEESTVLERALNTAVYFLMPILLPSSYVSPFNDDSMFIDLVPEKENVGLNELYLRSEMVLVNMDVICLDTPRVSAPHYKYVGAISAKPARPLPPDIEKFVSAAKFGVIVLSFGSAIPTLPDEMLRKMITAFSDIKQRVVMRHSGGIPQNLPANILLSKWLPQNDLLGHPNTKLFITHAGNNGQLEAVYHGIPMLSMPLFGDQAYDAKRVEVRGYGKTLDPNDFTVQQLKEIIVELTENDEYYNKIQHCSQILKSLPGAQESILFWVEHILKFGGSHLKPYYLRMPLWKFAMLDVALLFLILTFAFVYLCKLCCISCCCKRKQHQKVD